MMSRPALRRATSVALAAAIPIALLALAVSRDPVKSVWAAFFVFAVVMVVQQVARSREHGPQVLWLPKFVRPRVNEYFRGRGWPEPYDDVGRRRDWWTNR
jgi:hypothetical protein